MTLPLVNKKCLLTSIYSDFSVFFCWFFFNVRAQYMIFRSSPTLLILPLHIFGQEPATQTQSKALKGEERHGL